jgi:acetyl-CoA acyltransferase 1
MGQTSENVAGQFYGAIGSGLEPRIMGIGPTIAIPKILEKTGLTSLDVDVFEINKAFASMVRFDITKFKVVSDIFKGVYCIEKLGLDLAKVNPRGGAM